MAEEEEEEEEGMEMKVKVKVGIMGCASIARKIVRALTMARHARLYAIASRSIEKAQAFAVAANCAYYDANNKKKKKEEEEEEEVEGYVRIYGRYEELLADEGVEAVYLPLPTSLHLRWAVEAAKAGKHVLLEKPCALSCGDLDVILKACAEQGVQFMDATMFMHHPRTLAMADALRPLAPLHAVHSTFTFQADEEFLKGNIRVNPELDALGALGDVGWYCIRGILWANSYDMPNTVVALPGHVTNEAGVIMACGAHFLWEDGRVATFHCSFLSDMCMDLTVNAKKGLVRVHDFVIPFQEDEASFIASSNVSFVGVHTGWDPLPTQHIVHTELPQEVLMLDEFSKLVQQIRDSGTQPNPFWPSLTRKTQKLLDAVVTSIKGGLVSVTVVP